MIELRRRDGRVLLIGHRGAPALAAENSLESLAHAVAHRVDAVELDVLPTRAGGLVLAHSRVREGLPTLDDALGLFARDAPGVGVQLDLKRPGYEGSVVDALRRHELLDRSFVSSCFPASLAAVAELEPRLPLSLTYPRDRLGIGRRRVLLPMVTGAMLALRQALPRRLDAWLDRARASAATLHWAVASPAAIRRCHDRGAAVIAWTVDHPRLARRLVETGVDGIITNDPRIFDGGIIT